jgi:hypothetical protein
MEKELLYTEYIINQKTSREIAALYNKNQKTVLSYLKKYNITTRNPKDGIDISNNEYGQLKVMSRCEDKSNGRCFKWLCKCTCGQIEAFESHYLISGKQYRCRKCAKIDTAKSLYTGIENLSGKYLSTIRRGARQRNLEYEVTKEYLYNIFQKQDGKCALSNLPIHLGKQPGSQYEEQTASLDRIDSNKGYIEGNVQWLHKEINMMKQDFSELKFLMYCQLIVNTHNKVYE